LSEGVLGVQTLGYRGKRYDLPVFDVQHPIVLSAQPLEETQRVALDCSDSPVLADIDTPFDLSRFTAPRKPVSLGHIRGHELETFHKPGAVRLLDMPIKMPGIAEVRLPRAMSQFASVLQRILDVECHVNPAHLDYFAYLTIDQRYVAPGTLHREAPCHVDGFQGARWSPKARGNHSYTVSDVLPTGYYVQPFDFDKLDERVHDFFWEMNAQVADTDEAHRWQPDSAEITLMDCYCVHRGVENDTGAPVFRTWLRLSFEERRRVFDRLGNAFNPLFDYHWDMVERDIEQLGLVAYRQDGDPSLRVFPWQDTEGKPLPAGAPKTGPRLRKA